MTLLMPEVRVLYRPLYTVFTKKFSMIYYCWCMKKFFMLYRSEGEEILEINGIDSFWWHKRKITRADVFVLCLHVFNVLSSALSLTFNPSGLFVLESTIILYGMFMISPFVSRSLLPLFIGYWFSR